MAKKEATKKTTSKKEVEKKPKKTKVVEKKPVKEEVTPIWERIMNIDHKKATKLIIGGMVIAMIFGTAALISDSIASNASDWENYKNHENDLGYWNADYGYQEYLERGREINTKADWMRFQEAIFENAARIFVNFGLLCVMVGFIGYSAEEEMDPKKRQLSFLLAAIIIVVVMFTSLTTGVTISIG